MVFAILFTVYVHKPRKWKAYNQSQFILQAHSFPKSLDSKLKFSKNQNDLQLSNQK